MHNVSAGLLVYRRRAGKTEVFLVHPGGPFWSNKDDGAWSIPKGEVSEGEDPLSAAQREFEEETGAAIRGDFVFTVADRDDRYTAPSGGGSSPASGFASQ